MIARLATHIWVQAQIRTANARGIPLVVVRRGDGTAGTVLFKLNRGTLGCCVLCQTRLPDGTAGWLQATGSTLVDEAEADAYIARSVRTDPDAWVLELEDAAGRLPFDDPVI